MLNYDFMQNAYPVAAGYVVDQITEHPSNWECKEQITDFIQRYRVPCLYNVDTRAVTRELRRHGVMKGVIVRADRTEEEIKQLLNKSMHTDQIARVTTKKTYVYGQGKYKVALVDCGLKKSILERFAEIKNIYIETGVSDELWNLAKSILQKQKSC